MSATSTAPALQRTLGQIAGMANLPDKLRQAAAEAALQDDEASWLDALAKLWIAAEAHAKALQPRISELGAAKRAADEALNLARDCAVDFAQANGERRLETPEFEITVHLGKQGVRATAPLEDLPDRFVKVERTLKRREAAEAVLKDGEVIPGIEPDNGAPYATIKRRRHTP